jgi:hypothetical protein
MSLCDYGCGQKAQYETSNGKVCCSENYQSCPAIRQKNSKNLKKEWESGKRDTTHLDGNRAWNKGKTFDIGEGGKKPIKDTAKKDSIKCKLIQKRDHRCEGCSRRCWKGEKIPLEIHRIDETKTYEESDKRNFKLLCPNCHAQTDNFAGRSRTLSNEKKVTDKELEEALKSEPSIRQALISVGLDPTGANYKRPKRILQNMAP